jgi:hypothetical protein
VTVKSKEENSLDCCLDFVQEFSLWRGRGRGGAEGEGRGNGSQGIETDIPSDFSVFTFFPLALLFPSNRGTEKRKKHVNIF